jgi:ubiquinone/menaquinone biosynthesis C-methylase UbiE
MVGTGRLSPLCTRPRHPVSARRPHRALELAAGTGVLTRELVSALGAGTVVASDLNPAMVEFGRQQVPDANWRQADAMALPFLHRDSNSCFFRSLRC